MAGVVDWTDPANLQQALFCGNPHVAATAAQMAAVVQQKPSTDILVTLYSNTYKPLGECHDYISLKAEFPRNDVETATIVMKHTDPLVPVAMNCYQAVVPITIEVGYMRWSGRVENCDYSFKDGEYTVTLQCTGDFNWFNKILVWPNFLLPIQTQFPTRSLYVGNAITCIKTMIAEQSFRLQTGLWEFVDQIASFNFDWRAWAGTFLESDGNFTDMLLTPIVVVPTDPGADTSPYISINGRMDKVSTLVTQIVKMYGLVLSANLWLPGDPQPAGLLAELTIPTIVVDVKDRSGVTGPTGTFIDGIITDVVDLQNSVLGGVLSPFLNPNNEYAPEGINIAPILGLNFVPPWVLFQDHPRGGLREFHLTPHAPLAHTVVGGGKSPKWVNDLINASLEYVIDAIEIAVGFTGVPDTLLDGTFDDVLLAFQEIENFDRREALGPYAFPEYFQQTGASAYTLDEWFALQSAMWDTRGYHGITLTFDNGYPYTVGKDIFVGCLASFALQGNLYTDYVERVTVDDDRKSRAKVTCMIGDGKSHDDPTVRIQRTMTSFQEAFQIVTMSN